MGGPTQSAVTGAGSVWKRRPVVARMLQAAILAGPVVVTLAGTWAIGRWLPASRLGMANWLWWLIVAALGVCAILVTERLLRRFTPVAALMMLSIAFPDEAPTRFGHALRRGTVKQLARLRDEHNANGTFSDETTYSEYLLSLAAAIADHDRLTRGHSERVRAYSGLIAEELELSADDRNKLQWAALLHDVGKLDVPSSILQKPGRPTEREWARLQHHPEASRSYLEPLKPWLGEWLDAAEYHHARFDGTGYPHPVAARSIPLAGRIVAVADAFDVMTSRRSYKSPMDPDDARAEIIRCAGTQFDPVVVRAFMNIDLKRLGVKAGPIAWLGHTLGLEGSLGAGGGALSGTATATASTATTGAAAATSAAATTGAVASTAATAAVVVPNVIAATAVVATGAVEVPVPLELPDLSDIPSALAFGEAADELPEPEDLVVDSDGFITSTTQPAVASTTAAPTTQAAAPTTTSTTTSTTSTTTTSSTTTRPAVPNEPPTFAFDLTPKLFSVDREDYAFGLVATDPEGGPVEFLSLEGLPPGASFDLQTGLITAAISPDLVHAQTKISLTVRARDEQGAIGEMTFDTELHHYRAPGRPLVISAVKYGGEEFVRISNRFDSSVGLANYRLLDHDPLTGSGDLDHTLPDVLLGPGESYELRLFAAPDGFDPDANPFIGHLDATDVLAPNDDLLLLNGQARFGSYISWGDGGDIGLQPRAPTRPWIDNENASLAGLADGEWLELATLNDIAYKKSACWQRNGTNEAADKLCGYLD